MLTSIFAWVADLDLLDAAPVPLLTSIETSKKLEDDLGKLKEQGFGDDATVHRAMLVDGLAKLLGTHVSALHPIEIEW